VSDTSAQLGYTVPFKVHTTQQSQNDSLTQYSRDIFFMAPVGTQREWSSTEP